jgi:hypothetical protein
VSLPNGMQDTFTALMLRDLRLEPQLVSSHITSLDQPMLEFTLSKGH